MVLRHAEGRRPAAARSDSGRARRGHDAEGRDAVQHPVDRHASDVHRPRLVHGLRTRRPVGRLPAVLRDVPLSALTPGLPQHPVPSLAARPPRRDERGGMPVLPVRPRLPSIRRADARLPAGEGTGPLRGLERRCPAGAARGRLRRRPHQEQRLQPAPDGGTPALDAGALHLVGTTSGRTRTARRIWSARPTSSGGFCVPGAGRWSGTSAATPASTPGWPPSTRSTSWPSTPTRSLSSASTGRC